MSLEISNLSLTLKYQHSCDFVTSSISRFYVNEWEAGTSTHQFLIYRQIQQEYNANPLWTYAFYHPELLGACFSVAQLIVYFSHFETDCSRCEDNHVHVNITEHLLTRCTFMDPQINTFMEKVRMFYGHSIFICLRSMSYEDFVLAIFGINPRFYSIINIMVERFYVNVVYLLHSICISYRQAHTGKHITLCEVLTLSKMSAVYCTWS